MMIRTKSSKQIDMTNGPILWGMIRFAIPLILSSFLNQLFNTADTLMVGRWGGDTPEARELALAAVGSCSVLISTLINLFTGLSAGTSVLVARELGAKDDDAVKKTVSASVVLGAISGLFCMIIGILGARPLLAMIGTDEVLLEDATAYMRAYFLGVPASMTYSFCAAVLLSKGDSKRPLIFLTVAGAANVILNAVMIFAFGLGAVGVGIATAAGQWVSLLMILVYMSRMEGTCRIEWKKLKPDFQKLGAILRIGVPASAELGLYSFSSVFAQAAINAFGSAMVAGNAAAANVENYLALLQGGFSRAGSVYLGQNIGAQNLGRVKRSIIVGTAAVAGIGIASGLLLYLFAEEILSLFAPGNAEVIAAGMQRVSVTFLPYFISGIMYLGGGLLRGMGQNVLPTVISIAGSCVFRVIWIEVFYRFFFYGNATVLFMVYPVSWVLTAVAAYLAILWTYYKRTKPSIERREDPCLAAKN